MKNTHAIILTLLTLTSCSVQKRMYSPGYNFTWNINKHNVPTHNTTIINNSQMEENAHYDSLVIDDYVASTEAKIVVDKTEKISLTTDNKVKLNTVKNMIATLDTVDKIQLKTDYAKHIQKDERVHSAIIKFGASNSIACVLFSIIFLIISLFNIGNLFLYFLMSTILGFTGVAALIAGFIGMLQIATKPDEYKGGWRLLVCFLPLLMILAFLIF